LYSAPDFEGEIALAHGLIKIVSREKEEKFVVIGAQ